jgi:hypothetical protein
MPAVKAGTGSGCWPPHPGGEVRVCDLVGSTERQTNLGDDAADPFRCRFFTALRTTAAHNGVEVKRPR